MTSSVIRTPARMRPQPSAASPPTPEASGRPHPHDTYHTHSRGTSSDTVAGRLRRSVDHRPARVRGGDRHVAAFVARGLAETVCPRRRQTRCGRPLRDRRPPDSPITAAIGTGPRLDLASGPYPAVTTSDPLVRPCAHVDRAVGSHGQRGAAARRQGRLPTDSCPSPARGRSADVIGSPVSASGSRISGTMRTICHRRRNLPGLAGAGLGCRSHATRTYLAATVRASFFDKLLEEIGTHHPTWSDRCQVRRGLAFSTR